HRKNQALSGVHAVALSTPTYLHTFEGWSSCLVRIKTNLELLGPVRVGITQALDIDAAWQAAFDSCFHKCWSKKSERERHVDLTYRAALALCQLPGVSD